MEVEKSDMKANKKKCRKPSGRSVVYRSKVTENPAELQSCRMASSVTDSEFREIRALAATLPDQHRQRAAALAPIVQNIIQTGSRDGCEIERTLDHLLDCACIPEGLALFKSLCRYYFTLNSAAIADYVNAYREMWHNEADEEKSGV